MNNTIFRRKFIVGVLIALVLGFGAYGTADALTFGTTRTGDLQTLSPGQRFVVSFSVNLRSREAIQPRTSGPASQTLIDEAAPGGSPPASRVHAGYTDGDTYYWTTVSGTVTTYNWVTESEAYYFNDQQVTIAPTGATIISIGNYNVDPTTEAASITLNQMAEWSDGRSRLPGGTIRVTLEASDTPVAVTIAITDATENDDLPGGADFNKSVFEMFRLYVLQLETASRAATISTELAASVVNDDQDTAISVALTGAASDFARVGFEVYEGPGTLYEDKNSDGSPDSTATKSITAFTNNHGTANNATVYLKTNGGTSKVRAWVFGNSPTTNVANKTSRATYIYRWSNLRKVSGDVTTQIGVISTQLEHPFIVELTDANGDAISGETITYAVEAGGGTLGKDPNFPDELYAADFPTTATAMTDSDGRANVLLTLGAAAGENTVTATYDNATLTFSATAQAESAAASIEIVSGNNQSAGENLPLPAPLVVRVRDQDGLIISGQTVRFSTDSGALSVQTSDPGTLVPTPTPTNSDRNQTVTTDGTGRAAVRYNVGNVAGVKRITAILLETYDQQTRNVVFTATGGGPSTSARLAVNAPTSGTTGQTITVTATASGRTTNSGQLVAFSSSRGGTFSPISVQTNSSGIATTQFTLPSTSGPVTITATASDYTDGSTTITVQSLQPAGTLSVLTPTTPITGTVGETINIIINVGSPNVTVELSGTGFQTVSRSTGNATTVTIPVILPNTDGNYVLTASASGYTDLPIGVSVSEASTPTPTNIPVRLQIPSGTNQAQTVSVGSSATLRVRVTRTDTNSAQSGVEVTFRDSRGNDLERVNTNNNGEATYQLSVTSAGVQRVTAVITGTNVDTSGATSVIFTITGEELLKTLTVTSPGPGRSGAAGSTMSITIRAESSNIRVTLSGNGFQTVSGLTDGSNTVTLNVVLPDTTGLYQTLKASADGYHDQPIHITVTEALTPTNVPVRLTIPSGQTQTVTIGSSAALQVLVTRTGTNQPQSGVEVTFRDSGGNDLATRTTNSSGEATYQLSVTSTARRLISAVITDTNVDTSGATPVTFDITGTATQPTVSTRLTIIQPVDSLGQTRNTAGPGVSYPLTILFNNVNNTPAVNQVVTITVRNAAQVVTSSTVLVTDNTGRATTPDTFRLPTAAGTYTITAVSGTQTRAVTVTVFAIRLVKDSSDSVSGDNQEGNRGEVLDDPFVVRVVRDTDNTAVQGVPVTFTVIDGDGELSTSSSATSGSNTLTVNSDTNGDVRAYLVLGQDDEDNRVRASVGITNVADVFFDATGALVPDALEIVSGDDQRIAVNQRSDPMRVLVTDEDGDELEGVVVTFSLRGGSGTLTPRSAETNRFGEAEAELLPRSAGTYTITARVVGITTVTFTITVGDLADDIEIVSGNNQRGDTGTELANPFVVEVLDEDDDPVSGVTVTFSVTAGGGSLSDTSVDTNNRGRAQTYLTLGDSPGRNTVRASVSGVSTRVTFTATAVDPAPPEPDIRVPASQRADAYWINTDSGTLHRLVGSSVENIAPGVENVVSLVVTSNRLYWVETTGENSGRLRRSNLNGTNVQLIRDLTATPAGITVDTANSKIYLTNGFGKVQAINLDGSGYVPSLVRDLNDPTDIAVGSGKIYWITGGGTVHSANVDGSGVTQIAGGYGALNGIAVGGGKVFWTEDIGGSEGKIHSANLDGSGVEELVSLLATPYGISVDTADSKLYFTNSRGRIMQSNLSGGSIQTIVADLVSPGDVSVPSGTTAPRPPGTFSRYDVNRDGKVDNTDAALVANALGESPPSDPNLDVNGDGNVNFLDLLLVFDNRDESNAAPVAVASERPKVSREEVQHQIDLLLATDNHSATAQFTLAYLQSLLAVVTPEQTRLLANYPNPFNPETWIPYQLAASSKVQITIYNSAGKEVRTLSLGHQSEGYYTDRSRAAYWDGRNAIGERVSSGVYFYTLTTDRMSATRKMLILK